MNDMQSHLQKDRYGDFALTEAVRPAPALDVVPQEGYRMGMYEDPASQLRVPVLAAAVSREQLFDVFLALLAPLGDLVDVVLETSHQSRGGKHRDLHREQIDLPVLESYFCDFEDLLLNDGCTGVAVISATMPIEVQFDEHKLLIIYAPDLKEFEAILRDAGLRRNDSLKLISEGQHLHRSDDRHVAAFQQFSYRLGVGEAAQPVNW